MSSPFPHALFASGADVNVDFDITFLAQIALFGLFITVLKPVLFDPLIKLFEAREKLTDGARDEARKMDARANELIQDYDKEIEKVRVEAAAERDRLRADTAKLEATMLEEAKADAAKILAQGREQTAATIASMRTELEGVRPALAEQVAAKLLGREVSS